MPFSPPCHRRPALSHCQPLTSDGVMCRSPSTRAPQKGQSLGRDSASATRLCFLLGPGCSWSLLLLQLLSGFFFGLFCASSAAHHFPICADHLLHQFLLVLISPSSSSSSFLVFLLAFFCSCRVLCPCFVFVCFSPLLSHHSLHPSRTFRSSRFSFFARLHSNRNMKC